MKEQFQKRRYKVVDDRLMKRWDGFDGDGWVKTKAEALGISPHEAAPAPAATQSAEQSIGEAPESVAAVNWNQPWMSVKADLRSLGFTGRTKAEAIKFAKDKGLS